MTDQPSPKRGRPPRGPVTPAGDGIHARGNPDEFCSYCGRPPPIYDGWVTRLSRADGRCRRCRNNTVTKQTYAEFRAARQSSGHADITTDACLGRILSDADRTVERETCGHGEVIVIARGVFRDDAVAALRARSPLVLTRLIRRLLKRVASVKGCQGD